MEPESAPVLYACEESIATLTLDRDAKRNAFDAAMSQGVAGGIARAEAEGARVIILRARPGAQVWCAGHDLKELADEDFSNGPSAGPMFSLFEKMQATPLPVIAMVEGSVYAGGLLLLLYSDIVVASLDAQVAMTANLMGLPFAPEIYATWLRVMGMHKVKEMLFTASAMSAEEARACGLYNHVVSREELEPFTQTLAGRICRCAPEALANTKLQLNLIARQSALGDGERQVIDESSRAIWESPELKQRILARLASLR